MSSVHFPGHIAEQPDFSVHEFRTSLGMFATGVTIVTTRTQTGERVGLTASSFNAVSLQPPLVLWSLARTASCMNAFANSLRYAINVLTSDQQELAKRFAERRIDRWAGVVAFTDSANGIPLLANAAATFECFNRRQYVEGDHVIFVGEVERCSHRVGASPLLFHGGQLHSNLCL